MRPAQVAAPSTQDAKLEEAAEIARTIGYNGGITKDQGRYVLDVVNDHIKTLAELRKFIAG